LSCSSPAATGNRPKIRQSEDAGLLEPQRQALERARGVEDDLAEAARRKQDRIDEEQDGTPRD
jgi:hypothetical protein